MDPKGIVRALSSLSTGALLNPDRQRVWKFYSFHKRMGRYFQSNNKNKSSLLCMNRDIAKILKQRHTSRFTIQLYLHHICILLNIVSLLRAN